MASYLAPGIYIEEIPTGPRPISAVGTSVAGFVGLAPDAGAFVNRPVAVDSWEQFLRRFAPAEGEPEPTDLARAVHGFFLNGGGRCYIVNVGKDGEYVGDARRRKGIDILEEADEVAIVAAPGQSDAGVHDALVNHCEKMKDRVAILDPPAEVGDLELLKKLETPPAKPKPPLPAGGGPAAPGAGGGGGGGAIQPGGAGGGGLLPRPSDGGFSAFYFPYIEVKDPFNPKENVFVPPSGHVAGIYARSDMTRGVHKAPANEVIRGALNVRYNVTRAEQEGLNPLGVNCIRFFPRGGIRVWGARTRTAEESSEWRYINVRRLFAMIEKSILLNTNWVVFEPNDETLWKSIRRDVGAFLRQLWRDGALMGRTPAEAFFVKCDADTNPPESIGEGRVVTVIGVAPVRPAEFVIFRIGQYAPGLEAAG
jgi:hypothetical protein